MLKKLTLLAMAIAAFAALAAPAVGQAAVFVDPENPELEEGTLTLSGPVNFEIPGFAGFHAILETKSTIFSGTDKGEVNTFDATNCTGTGALENIPCTITNTEPNWPVTALGPGEILIEMPEGEGQHLVWYGDAGHTVPVATSEMVGEVIATYTGETIEAVELEPGEELFFNGNPATVNGELEAGEGAGTFGVE